MKNNLVQLLKKEQVTGVNRFQEGKHCKHKGQFLKYVPSNTAVLTNSFRTSVKPILGNFSSKNISLLYRVLYHVTGD